MFLGTNLQTSKPIQTLLVSKATNEIFFFPWVVFKVTKKWQWLQVKSNALFLKISIPPSHPLQKFQFWLIHTFLLKIWLLRSPPPPPHPLLGISNKSLGWAWNNFWNWILTNLSTQLKLFFYFFLQLYSHTDYSKLQNARPEAEAS